MQPLVSPVDHESRRNIQDGDSWIPSASFRPCETTPLLQQRVMFSRSNTVPLFAIILAVFLIFGICVSVYLLIEQDKSWPINFPYHLVPRIQWADDCVKRVLINNSTIMTYLFVLETGTPQCTDILSCCQILSAIKNIDPNNKELCTIPYNFMLSSDGITYEGLGYNALSEIDTKWNSTSIFLAFIGNYSNFVPPKEQILEMYAFINEAIWLRKLSNDYKITGNIGGQLYSILKLSPNWKDLDWNPDVTTLFP